MTEDMCSSSVCTAVPKGLRLFANDGLSPPLSGYGARRINSTPSHSGGESVDCSQEVLARSAILLLYKKQSQISRGCSWQHTLCFCLCTRRKITRHARRTYASLHPEHFPGRARCCLRWLLNPLSIERAPWAPERLRNLLVSQDYYYYITSQ